MNVVHIVGRRIGGPACDRRERENTSRQNQRQLSGNSFHHWRPAVVAAESTAGGGAGGVFNHRGGTPCMFGCRCARPTLSLSRAIDLGTHQHSDEIGSTSC